jgi:phosphopantothenoylcysteine decarboxylase/phosphopantothenate--cysteine ligase
MTPLLGKKILLGITGGIAAYKSAYLLRLLIKSGATVQVVMTAAAEAFVTPLTYQALSGLPVKTELLDSEAEAAMGHIELAKWADLIVIAPASADFLARLAGGIANDLLSTLCLATAAPIAVAPAMNQQMWAAESTQANLEALIQRKVHILGPAIGDQACGDVGLGRMLEAEQLNLAIEELLQVSRLLAGKKVLITAGPTFEAIDPVRYIGNRSSGKMGYALAQAFVEAGAEVTLVSGPTALSMEHLQPIMVESANQMQSAVNNHLKGQDIFVGCAAVADYHVLNPASEKLKKSDQQLVLTLEKNPDIIIEVASSEIRPKLVIGFAAETENVIQNATSKLHKKGLDMICANDVSGQNTGFGSEFNQLILITSDSQETLKLTPKPRQAAKIVEKITDMLATK